MLDDLTDFMSAMENSGIVLDSDVEKDMEELNTILSELETRGKRVEIIEEALKSKEAGKPVGDYVIRNSFTMEDAGIKCLRFDSEEDIHSNLIVALEEEKNWFQRAWARIVELWHRFWNWVTGKTEYCDELFSKKRSELGKKVCDGLKAALNNPEEKAKLEESLKSKPFTASFYGGDIQNLQAHCPVIEPEYTRIAQGFPKVLSWFGTGNQTLSDFSKETAKFFDDENTEITNKQVDLLHAVVDEDAQRSVDISNVDGCIDVFVLRFDMDIVLTKLNAILLKAVKQSNYQIEKMRLPVQNEGIREYMKGVSESIHILQRHMELNTLFLKENEKFISRFKSMVK